MGKKSFAFPDYPMCRNEIIVMRIIPDFIKKKKDKKTIKEGQIIGIQSDVDSIGDASIKDTASNELPPAAESKEEEKDDYYLSRSGIFNAARYITIVLLLGLIIIMFTVFSDIFTGENFKYLLKHLDINSSASSDSFETVYFGNAGNTLFSEYQGEVLLAFSGGVKIYDSRGALSLSSANSTSNPRISVSEKYILVYDRNDSDYYIYNSLSLLSSKKAAGNIIKGYMSEKGVFAIMSSGSEYSALISVFNENFELISEIKRQNSVTDFAISDDGKYLILSGVSISNALPVAEVCIYDLQTSKLEMSEKITGETPLRTAFVAQKSGRSENDESNLLPKAVLLTDKALHTFGDNENKEYYYTITENSVYDLSGQKFVYTVKKDTISDFTELIIVDVAECTEERRIQSSEKISKIRIKDDDIYFLTPSTIVLASPDEGEKKIDVQDCIDIVPLARGVMAVSKDKAVFYNPEE